METTISRQIIGKTMEDIFNNGTLNVRHYNVRDLQGTYDANKAYIFDIVIRHSEDTDAHELFKQAADKFATNKRFNVMYNVGTSKYVVHFHNGIHKHKDGSDFFDIECFKNKVKFAAFQKELKEKGYKEEGFGYIADLRRTAATL